MSLVEEKNMHDTSTAQTARTPYGDPLGSIETKIKAKDVCVFYGEKQALFDVSLDIGANQFGHELRCFRDRSLFMLR